MQGWEYGYCYLLPVSLFKRTVIWSAEINRYHLNFQKDIKQNRTDNYQSQASFLYSQPIQRKFIQLHTHGSRKLNEEKGLLCSHADLVASHVSPGTCLLRSFCSGRSYLHLDLLPLHRLEGEVHSSLDHHLVPACCVAQLSSPWILQKLSLGANERARRLLHELYQYNVLLLLRDLQ